MGEDEGEECVDCFWGKWFFVFGNEGFDVECIV